MEKLELYPELQKEVQTYKVSADANADNVGRIGNAEQAKNEAVAKRDNLKSLIRSITGLDELSEDNLKGAFGNETDAFKTLKGDNETLQSKLGKLKEDFDGLEGKHISEIDGMVMLDTLRSLGVDQQVFNQNALTDLGRDLLIGATRDGSQFSFRDEEGKTRFNDSGIPSTIQDRIDELREDESKYYFKPITGGGSSSVKTDSSNSQTTDGQVAAYFSKHGRLPDGYGK